MDIGHDVVVWQWDDVWERNTQQCLHGWGVGERGGVNRVANTNTIMNRRRQPSATLCIYRGPRATFNRQTSHS